MSFTVDVHHHILPDFFWRETNDAHNPVGDLLDHLVAVHRTVCQQDQDGCADVATLASPVSAAPAAWATAEAEASALVEAEAPAAWTESAEAGLQAGPEWAVPMSVAVLADVLAEIATGLPFSFKPIRAAGIAWSCVNKTSHFSGIAR